MLASCRGLAIVYGGAGYLAGEFPDGITSVEGVPTTAEVSVRLRAPGRAMDGTVLAVTVSNAAGEWNVSGLNPALRFDVVGRKADERDAIASDVTPAT